ncbi:hypothetical protein [Chryseobacterium sp. JV558]|uniref:hypothetical protein n=1 Tax=Chryseobacterium sp. JV558 TaxID=2663236 RepID=UPI00299DB06D|nr:hypothetical protein [Chryseobacterium sp. JV558]MDW9382776.1 hypothetical protein [Chryseobacterium sp. JV558]
MDFIDIFEKIIKMKDFFIMEKTIKINVITIDGKRITKSIFNQLNVSSPFTHDINGYSFNGEKILGYVSDKGYWLIYAENEKIYRYNLSRMFAIAQLSSTSDYSRLKELFHLYGYFGDNIINEDYKHFNEIGIWNYSLGKVLNKDILQKVENLILDAHNWKTEILNHQIFI